MSKERKKRTIKGINDFRSFDLEYLFEEYQMKAILAHPLSGDVRVLLEIQSDDTNNGRLIHLTIENVKDEELSIAIMKGGYTVGLENIIGLTEVNEVYSRVYIKANGLRVSDEHGEFGVGEDENEESLYRQSYFTYQTHKE